MRSFVLCAINIMNKLHKKYPCLKILYRMYCILLYFWWIVVINWVGFILFTLCIVLIGKTKANYMPWWDKKNNNNHLFSILSMLAVCHVMHVNPGFIWWISAFPWYRHLTCKCNDSDFYVKLSKNARIFHEIDIKNNDLYQMVHL